MLISGFPSSDIQKVFADAFRGIESLVDEQISKIKEKKLPVTVRTAYMMKIETIAHGIKGVILVGGLGSSPYLYEHLNEHLKKSYRKNSIVVLQSSGIKP